MSETKQTNSPSDLWKDPKGNVVKVDQGKWNESDLEQRLKDGWTKYVAPAPVAAAKGE